MCVDGICAGDSYDDAVAGWGEPVCSYISVDLDGYGYSYHSCDFPNFVGASFDDDDDGLDGSEVFDSISLSPGATTMTEDGLGLDAEFACFVDVLGDPSSISVEPGDDGWVISSMSWSEAGVYAYDRYDNKDWSYGEVDGLVDRVTVYGPF